MGRYAQQALHANTRHCELCKGRSTFCSVTLCAIHTYPNGWKVNIHSHAMHQTNTSERTYKTTREGRRLGSEHSSQFCPYGSCLVYSWLQTIIHMYVRTYLAGGLNFFFSHIFWRYFHLHRRIRARGAVSCVILQKDILNELHSGRIATFAMCLQIWTLVNIFNLCYVNLKLILDMRKRGDGKVAAVDKIISNLCSVTFANYVYYFFWLKL